MTGREETLVAGSGLRPANESWTQGFRIPLLPDEPLRLDYILDSGQVFRWHAAADGWWYGSLRGAALALRDEGAALAVRAAGGPVTALEIRKLLGLDDSLSAIGEHLAFDPVVRRAMALCRGLRVAQQDPWEGLVAFICSSHNAVFRIQQMLGSLSELFGDRVRIGEETIAMFPPAERLAGLSLAELAPCRLGYRDAYVLEAARRVAAGETDLGALLSQPTDVARKALLRVPGVGPKVADCVLLLALCKKADVFPIDVWVRRAVLAHYREQVRAATGVTLDAEDKGFTDRQYRAVAAWARGYFAPHAGYAQAYLFFATRAGLI